MANQIGERIRQLRIEQHLFLRQVAHLLKIDTPMLSKIERGERPLKREQIPVLSEILKADKNELLTIWLADKLYDVVKDEGMALKAMQAAEDEVKKQNKKIKK